MGYKYIFIDESGSPQFFAKGKRPLWIEQDFVPVMFLGMVITDDKQGLRKAVLDFQSYILNDPLLNSIYSVRQPGWYLHARTDHSDINLKTVEFIRNLEGFEFHAVIGRKIPDVFVNKHNGNQTEFYFDLLFKLLGLDDLEHNNKYRLYLSQRQSNTEQRFAAAFEKAVKAKSRELGGFDYTCSVVRSQDSPEMSIADYLIWALQRYILKGEPERRYYTALEKHYKKILDVYDEEGEGRLYGEENKFDLSKASPFAIK
jgi:hypothetical protein